ncbi:Innexin eat-5 [Dictyocoela muelleri]|nr:Innexin eat-5 [Dictyocoela muelleri]
MSNRSGLFKILNIFCIPLIFFNGSSSHGYYLANLFILVKILFLINSSLQLFLLNTLLTKNSILYGLEVLENFLQGEYVIGSRIFPLNVYCDFNIMKIGQPTLYTVRINDSRESLLDDNTGKRKSCFFHPPPLPRLGPMLIANECI